MKKLCLFVSSLIFFLGCFIGLGLDSFAYNEDFSFPTAGVTITKTATGDIPGFNPGGTDWEAQSIYPIVFVNNNGTCTACTPLQYGRYRTRSYTFDQNPKPDFGDWHTISWSRQSVTINGNTEYVYRSSNISFVTAYSSLTNCIIFNSYESAYNYFNDPENPDNLENVENEEGQEIIQDSLGGATINWGGNDPDGSAGTFSPDTDNIPAPQFIIDTSNGNNHSIKFTNQIYNYSNHGVYGLVLKCSWLGFDDFTLSKTGNVIWNTDFKVYYNTTLDTSPIVTIYDVPNRENDIVRCPATINFNTNTESVSAFNSFLNLYPTSQRNVDYTIAGDQGELLIEFQDYLGEISCPYNTCVFSCYYYRLMADGTYHYGPISTSHFDVPAQGAVYRRGQSVLDPNPGVTPDDPNYNPGVTPGGTVTPGGIPYGDEVDPSTLYNNMKGLFAFIGELPQLVAGLFQFLPEWVIAFIAVSIGLLVAIGVVKLFVG